MQQARFEHEACEREQYRHQHHCLVGHDADWKGGNDRHAARVDRIEPGCDGSHGSAGADSERDSRQHEKRQPRLPGDCACDVMNRLGRVDGRRRAPRPAYGGTRRETASTRTDRGEPAKRWHSPPIHLTTTLRYMHLAQGHREAHRTPDPE